MARYVQSVLGKKEFLVKFEYGQKRETTSCSLVYVCLKQEAFLETDDTISYLPKKYQVELLTIDGDPGFG